MVLVTNSYLLKKAQRKKYAVGAFNIYNLEVLLAVTRTAKELKSPAIISVTPSALKYAGIANISSLVKKVAGKLKVPMSLHLDHGKELKDIKKAVTAGFTSVMYDGSALSFEKNVKNTKKAVIMAKSGVSVEAELGTLSGVEDEVSSSKNIYTDPEQAKEFVQRTGVDALAVAIGTSHGAYKFKGDAILRIDILKEIRKKIDVPLVLHGASGVKKAFVQKANHYGAEILGAKGVPDVQIRAAIREGVCKVNIDTDNRIAFTAGVREFLHNNPEVFDPRKYILAGMEEVERTVEQKIKLFGSFKRA
ncbi:class II fructose-bisphosphate aldolase [Candidatus Woesearchaeota archaeon]|nr:class II fructose-bisphosphate aldolase [Candidatus Woesearchaeota archaeon]